MPSVQPDPAPRNAYDRPASHHTHEHRRSRSTGDPAHQGPLSRVPDCPRRWPPRSKLKESSPTQMSRCGMSHWYAPSGLRLTCGACSSSAGCCTTAAQGWSTRIWRRRARSGGWLPYRRHAGGAPGWSTRSMATSYRVTLRALSSAPSSSSSASSPSAPTSSLP